MTIPKGATHVDQNGNYFRMNADGEYEQHSAFTSEWLTKSDGYYILSHPEAECMGLVEVGSCAEYPGQFEPYSGLRCLIADEAAAEDHQLVSATVLAGAAMQEMMRC